MQLFTEDAVVPTLSGKNWIVYVGDVIRSLSMLPSNSVHCAVTSPPYWALRDYQTATWEGGDPSHDHDRVPMRSGRGGSGTPGKQTEGAYPSDLPAEICSCGAIRIDQQIGLEPTPAEFIAKLVAVFEEVKRVLRPDGTLWVNIGDTYASGKGTCFNPGGGDNSIEHMKDKYPLDRGSKKTLASAGLKPKDICAMPWRLAFALQDAGWWLRQDIIWHKPNPMPESVDDRCTKSHEYIFLLSKSSQYFYDQEAIREKGSRTEWSNQKFKGGDLTKHHGSSTGYEAADPTAGRNCRSVWTIPTEACKEAHFATFPSALPARCIKAGTSEKGCCPKCGAPWERIVEAERVPTRPGNDTKVYDDHSGLMIDADVIGNRDPQRHVSRTKTTGWQPSCSCNAGDPVPCTVLDMFSGSGTTGKVATELGRRYIGCELNPEYAELSIRRIESWKHRDVAKQAEPLAGQRGLFE